MTARPRTLCGLLSSRSGRNVSIGRVTTRPRTAAEKAADKEAQPCFNWPRDDAASHNCHAKSHALPHFVSIGRVTTRPRTRAWRITISGTVGFNWPRDDAASHAARFNGQKFNGVDVSIGRVTTRPRTRRRFSEAEGERCFNWPRDDAASHRIGGRLERSLLICFNWPRDDAASHAVKKKVPAALRRVSIGRVTTRPRTV